MKGYAMLKIGESGWIEKERCRRDQSFTVFWNDF